MGVLTTGDDVQILSHLTKKGKSFTIAEGATAKAVLTTLDRSAIISDIVDIDMGAVGTVLDESLLIVKFTEAQSAAISETGDMLLEIQLNDGGKLTWTNEIVVRKGNIP